MCWQVCEETWSRCREVASRVTQPPSLSDERLQCVVTYCLAAGMQNQQIIKRLLFERFALATLPDVDGRCVCVTSIVCTHDVESLRGVRMLS